VNTLVIIQPAFSTQQDIEALTTIAYTHLRQFAQALAQNGIIAPTCFIGKARTLQANDSAGPTGRDAISVNEVLGRVPTLHGP